ncbi:MAG: 5-enolpyruvylshikimate-3-phosphate synthase, partial [Lachnospiraceae bacterium]|nr:5-enolpyruvylshikimate-3-phosphate synthase [Lachnospiraceae bacterium]
HRIAMSFTVASLIAEGETKIKDRECVNISYPSFYEDLESLKG